MNARRCFAAALVAFALLPRPARAEVSDADRATARALTIEGYEALDRKDFATAADRFKRADALFHVPTVMLGMAHAEVGLGKLVSALATYSRIVREGVPPNSPAAFTKAVEDARREIEALTARVPNVIVNVKGADDAKVTIDGIEVPAAALGVKRPVDPGVHVVRATANGFAASEVSVTILEGKVETVTLEMKPGAAAPPVTPPPPVVPPPPRRVEPQPPPPLRPGGEGSSTQKTIGFVGIGLGAAGIVVGAVTGGLALSKHSSLLDKCPAGHCSASLEKSLQGDVDGYHTLGATSTGGFIGGGILAGVGIVLVATAPKPIRDAAVTPVIGLGYVGAQGRF